MRIDIENLAFSYPGRSVLSGINISVKPFEITCLIGPNGSGKSTIVKCVESLLKPSKGRILLGGEDVGRMTKNDLAKKIGYVPQSSRLTFSTTVFEMILMGRKPYSSWRSSDSDIDIVVDTIQMMKLDEIAMNPFDQLSGGQQQRVLMARALAQQPCCLLLDEPTSALDIAHQLELMDLMIRHVKDKGISVLMVVHDLNLVARYADSVVMLKEGQIHAQGTPGEVFTKKNLADVYGVTAVIGMQGDKVTIVPVARENVS